MRPGNNNRRGRNRGQRKQHGGIPNKNQSYDGGGSETRVRGNVYQVLEKYLQLARDAGVSGDRIAAENYLQHADHYYRVIQSMNDGQRPRVGGRDISVADFNVQNVSQGLSAALYTGGQAPQPNIGDGGGTNANPPQGNGGSANAGGNGGESDNSGDAAADGEEGGEFNAQQGRGSRNRHHNRHDNRQGQYGNGQYNTNGAAPEAEKSAPAPEPQQATASDVQPSEPVPTVGDDQPDYPEDLLPPVTTAEGAAREEGRSAGNGPRPRGRLRGRRPRPASGEAPPDPALPGVEGGE